MTVASNAAASIAFCISRWQDDQVVGPHHWNYIFDHDCPDTRGRAATYQADRLSLRLRGDLLRRRTQTVSIELEKVSHRMMASGASTLGERLSKAWLVLLSRSVER